MPECPACLQTSGRRRKGRCPKCEAMVFTYRLKEGKGKRTVWVTEKPSCKNLVDYLQDKIGEFRGTEDFAFEDYLANLFAASILLRKLKGNIELAYLVIDQFYPPRTGRGNRQHQPPGILRRPKSMRGIIWTNGDQDEQFALALSYARGALRARNAKTVESMEMF